MAVPKRLQACVAAHGARFEFEFELGLDKQCSVMLCVICSVVYCFVDLNVMKFNLDMILLLDDRHMMES